VNHYGAQEETQDVRGIQEQEAMAMGLRQQEALGAQEGAQDEGRSEGPVSQATGQQALW
jgi:hypothetical protein